MTTSTATILPRREPPGPTRPDGRTSDLLVLGGYTSDGQPTGAVYFWALSRFPGDFEVGLHRHDGLEILSVILDGTLSHYDTATCQWADLHPGDAQLMWAGSGVYHNERFLTGTRGFQVQFDPGPAASVPAEPSYTDYPAASFSAYLLGDALVTDLVGGYGPVEARTEGLSVRRIAAPNGARAELQVGADRVTLGYLIEGTAVIDATKAAAGDLISLDGTTMTIHATAPADLLVVSVPAHPSYDPLRLNPEDLQDHRPPFPAAGTP
jgi:quercetin 2,3-dioxygenase